MTGLPFDEPKKHREETCNSSVLVALSTEQSLKALVIMASPTSQHPRPHMGGSRRARASTHRFRVAAGPKQRAQRATRPWHAGRRLVKQHCKTLKMAELAISAGLPRPEIEDVSDCVTMRFHLGQFTPVQRSGTNATERQKAILALLDQADDGLSLREIHAQSSLDTSVRQARRALTRLRELRLADSIAR